SSRTSARSSPNHSVSAPLTRTTGGRICATSSRAAPFCAGATASSRSATTASAPEASADRSLRSSLPGANRSERAWARSTAVEPTLLDTPPKVRHKRRSVKAVVFHEFGGPDVLKLEELPAPSPGPGEVLLDILACALNHLDVD